MKQARAGGQWSLSYCLLVLCLAAHAQVGAPSGGDTQKSQRPEATFRVNVRLVNVFATVTDEHGAPVAGLTKDDFSVFEDGFLQSIRVFGQESELPLSIALAVDTSLSTQRDFKLEVASAKRFVHSIMRPVDHLAVFQVTENIDQITGFSSDLKRIDQGIDSLRIGAGTSLYDAIFLCSEALIDREGRKVLVLITDGGDTTSSATYERALRRAQQAEAIVYSIIIVPVATEAGRNTGGEHALIQISLDTGGKYYYAEGSERLEDAFRQIGIELRTQYLLAYYSNRQTAAAPFRRLQVQVNRQDGDGKQYQVRHRAGYYTAPAK